MGAQCFMNSDTTGDEPQAKRGGLFVQILLWMAFWLFTTTLALEWAVLFLPVDQLPNPYADIFNGFQKFRLAAFDLLTLVVPVEPLKHVGIAFSLGGLCISLMTISARQTIIANQSSTALASHDSFGALTLLEVWIGILVAVALWILAADMAEIGLTSGTLGPAIIPAALAGGLVLTALFAAYVRVGPFRFNPLHWILVLMGVSYGMTLL